MTTYEYVCDKVNPGCKHRHIGDTREAVREEAIAHLEGHHGMQYIDSPMRHEVDRAILPLA